MIGISKCLCGYDCTYRGDSNRIEELELIDKKGEAVLICPEVLGGLSIPRDPAEIVSEEPLCVQTVKDRLWKGFAICLPDGIIWKMDRKIW